MSDSDDDVIIIGASQTPNFDKQKEEFIVQEHQEFKVSIKQFQTRKQSFLGKQVQFYRIEIKHRSAIKYLIYRRFSDFQFLFEILKEHYPGYILPGFPQNNVMSFVQAKFTLLDKEDFFEKRMMVLQRFLEKLINMKQIGKSPELEKFISEEDEFEVYKKSRLHEVRKKGILDNALTTAASYFKTKRVDSKYQRILDQGMKIFNQLQSQYQNIRQYIQLNNEQIKAGLTLINSDYQKDKQFQKNLLYLEHLNKNYIKQFHSLLDIVYYHILDIKMFVGIIQKRYALKQNNELKLAQKLQINFQRIKDGFILEMEHKIKQIKLVVKAQISKHKDAVGDCWNS